MKNDCSLIATIPSLSNMSRVSSLFYEPGIAEVRFNTGVRSPFTPSETIKRLYHLAKTSKKRLWIDLKGRQLRVNVWADPLYECVELNHTIEVELPARMTFRNGTSSTISHIDGNKVFLASPPREALGKGQSVNIIGNGLRITDGYLTALDKEYISALKDIPDEERFIMASFVESEDDILTIAKELGDHEWKTTYCGKIESQKGLDFISTQKMFIPSRLMAARDDLFIELGGSYKKMKEALEKIVFYDPLAICASRIFTSLDGRESPSLSDFEDLEMMYNAGYRFFMLDDNVCNYAFDKAMRAWGEFINA